MAAVSFLETTNLVGLGLSADKVYSHVIDLNATSTATTATSTKSTEPTTPINKQPIQQQQQTGLKIVSDVVDGSYRVFDGIGKFWARNTQELENNKTVSGLVDRVKRVGDVVTTANQPLLKGQSELKEISTRTTTMGVKPASIHSENSTSSNSVTTTALPSFMEGRNNRTPSQQSKVNF